MCENQGDFEIGTWQATLAEVGIIPDFMSYMMRFFIDSHVGQLQLSASHLQNRESQLCGGIAKISLREYPEPPLDAWDD